MMTSAPVSELKTEDKPDVGKGIAEVGKQSYGSEESLVADFALVQTRSEALRKTMADLTALSESQLPGLDAKRDRLLKAGYYVLLGLSLLTEEEPEVASAASRLLTAWYPDGLAIIRHRHAKESDEIHTILNQATDEVHRPLAESTQVARILTYLGRVQSEFDASAAGRPADAQRVKELTLLIGDAEERWDSAYNMLVAKIKERWTRGSTEQETALNAVYRPIREAVGRLRSRTSRRAGGATETTPAPTEPTDEGNA
jgi:hypothetical protein